ncbi:MAG: OmpH family outer membrane protein [Rhodothermaceae bacterium]
MKKSLFLTGFILFLFSQSMFAQLKVGYIDSDYIIKQLPDAQDIQKQLDQFILEWKEELITLEKEYEKALKDFEERQLIMSEEKIKLTQKELETQQAEILKFRDQKFGVQGELFKKQEELMKPIQNRLFTAVKEIAEEDDYDFIFDRSGDMMFVYAKEKYDLTNKVLDKIK